VGIRATPVIIQLFQDLGRQRLRTALTVLGIAWGTTAVVTLLAFGTGLERQMRRGARGLGDGIVILSPGRTTMSFAGFGIGRQIRLRAADAPLLVNEIPSIRSATAEYGRWTAVRREDRTTNVYVTGIDPIYGELRNIFPQAGGRFIDDRDLMEQRRVLVLGNEIARFLFGDTDPVGQRITIDQTPFVVIGIMAEKPQNSSYNARDQDRVFIPSTTYRGMFGEYYPARIIYAPEDPTLSAAVATWVREALARRHTFDASDESAVYVWDTNEGMRIFTYIFLGFNIFLGIVGSFTLVVGGIGVANIMFVVVQERTWEIGLRRALGAHRREILLHTLAEAGLLVAIGAAIGMVIASAIVVVVGALPIEEFVGTATISPVVVAVTVALLGLVALAAGLMPARRAADLDPADALRQGA